MSYKRGLNRRICILFIALQAISFLLFYLPNYAIELPLHAIEGYLICRELFKNFTTQIIPMIAGGAVLILDGGSPLPRRLLRAIILSCTSLIYYLPYSYLYALSLGFDSIEAVLLSLPMAATDVIIGTVLCLALSLIGKVIYTKARAKSGEDGALVLKKSGLADMSDAMSLGLFGLCAARMGLTLILEIIDTVTFLIEEIGACEIGEILYIMLTYILIVAYTLGAYALLVFIKNKVSEE